MSSLALWHLLEPEERGRLHPILRRLKRAAAKEH
jgi:hypothetical protein